MNQQNSPTSSSAVLSSKSRSRFDFEGQENQTVGSRGLRGGCKIIHRFLCFDLRLAIGWPFRSYLRVQDV
jgi:hypothetical protein